MEVVPFILMLAAIAILPMVVGDWWDKNKNKLIVSLVLGLPIAAFLLLSNQTEVLIHSVVFDYIPFIILLGSLFVITGGIFIDADFEATPLVNLTILAVGGLLASFMGTTGAAMLLIRLLLHTNKQRERKTHTVLFFIAVVANCGGLLTPLGDPPLFMMYLRGVDFFWFFNFIKPWLFVNGMLLVVYYFFDNYHWKRETLEARAKDIARQKPLVIHGKLNFVWLLVVILSVAFVNPNVFPIMNEIPVLTFLRDMFCLLAAILSLKTTSRKVREENNFNWHPIVEVAFLFLGIFLTMGPVIELLQSNADKFNINAPHTFYYMTGALSSVLDNTPTAVTFYSLAKGMFAGNAAAGMEMVAGIPFLVMEAICLGAVFFGSLTYIGNGPNFMVKAIAEQDGIKMPQFFQYMIKFSLIIILPILILAQILFI